MNELNLIPATTEIFLALAIMAILVVGLFIKEDKQPASHVLSLIVLGICALLSLTNFNSGTTTYALSNMVVSDPMANLLKVFACLSTAMTLVYSRQYTSERGMLSGSLSGEFYVLALLTLLGQMIMISGNNFLIIYLGLELMSLSLYALVALRRDHVSSTEASMKYFVLGALASGFMLYGISMLYGATGSLDLSAVASATASGAANKTVLIFGLVFLVSGLAFKLGTAPFHMWVPDVYQGAPTAVTLMIAAAPKLAAFALLFRLLVNTLLPLLGDWQPMLVLLAVLSLVVGNVTAIAQTNVKRMLAYSAIAQMGFVLLGMLSVFDDHAFSAAMFYAITYVLTTLGTFGLLMVLSRKGYDCETLDGLKGLNKKHPWFAFIGLVMMFSLAGIPPTVGFAAKLGVLEALVDAEHTFLAVIAVIASLIGAFYYLRVVKVMYFDEPEHEITVSGSGFAKGILGLNSILVLAIGIVPAGLMGLCLDAMRRTLLGS